jgi:hypothetical protein
VRPGSQGTSSVGSALHERGRVNLVFSSTPLRAFVRAWCSARLPCTPRASAACVRSRRSCPSPITSRSRLTSVFRPATTCRLVSDLYRTSTAVCNNSTPGNRSIDRSRRDVLRINYQESRRVIRLSVQGASQRAKSAASRNATGMPASEANNLPHSPLLVNQW